MDEEWERIQGPKASKGLTQPLAGRHYSYMSACEDSLILDAGSVYGMGSNQVMW